MKILSSEAIRCVSGGYPSATLDIRINLTDMGVDGEDLADVLGAFTAFFVSPSLVNFQRAMLGTQFNLLDFDAVKLVGLTYQL